MSEPTGYVMNSTVASYKVACRDLALAKSNLEKRVKALEDGLSEIAAMVTDESGHNMQKVGAIARNLVNKT